MANESTLKENAKFFAVAFLNCFFQGAVMALGAHTANRIIQGHGPARQLAEGNVAPIRKQGG